MNIFHLAILIIIFIVYKNINILRRNNKKTSIGIFILALLSFKHIELFFLLLSFSLIIFFKKDYKESYLNFENKSELLGERLIHNMYNSEHNYPKINKLAKINHDLITENIDIGKRYKKTSDHIIRDDNYLKKNICNQVKEYGEQNNLNDQLYNSEYGIYSFENNETIETQGTQEWWDRYNQLQNNKNNVKEKLNKNSREILDLKQDNQIITRNLLNNREQLKLLRNHLNDNLKTINNNQKCLFYGMSNVTDKYSRPEKQNIHYGVTSAPNDYSNKLENVLDKKIFTLEDVINAYKKNPELISECLQEMRDGDGNGDDDDNNYYKNCNKVVETDQNSLSTSRIFYD